MTRSFDRMSTMKTVLLAGAALAAITSAADMQSECQKLMDEAMARGRMFRLEEAAAREKHICRLTGEAR